MRTLLCLLFASALQAVAQQDTAARLDSLLAQAQQAQASGDYQTAAAAYRAAVSIRSGSAELWSNLGVMQFESHQYAESEHVLRRAISINPSLFVPNLFLGLDLLNSNRPREAVPFLLTAAQQNPRDSQAALALGRSFHVLGQPDRAREWFEKATALAPHSGEAWYGLGIADLDLAEASGAKLATAFPHSGYIALLKAAALAKQGRLAESVAAYRALLSSGEQPPPCTRTQYGSVLLKDGDRSKAEEQFQFDSAACRVTSDSNPVAAPSRLKKTGLEELASSAFVSNDSDTALKAANQLLRAYPNNPAGLYWTVLANEELGTTALARAGEVEPDSPAIDALLGDAYQQRGMLRDAEQEYSTMLALQPQSIAALAGLATAYLHAGDVERAHSTLQNALAKSPDDPELNLLMGETLITQHSYADAEPYLKNALNARAALLPRVHALLGRVYIRMNRPDEAIAELRQGLASDDDGSVHYELARLYQQRGDTKLAADAFATSNQLRSKHNSSSILAPVAAQGEFIN